MAVMFYEKSLHLSVTETAGSGKVGEGRDEVQRRLAGDVFEELKRFRVVLPQAGGQSIGQAG